MVVPLVVETPRPAPLLAASNVLPDLAHELL
jgi:hypothetical protein